MLKMVMDTSTQILYISFVKDDKVIYESITQGKNNHSDNLLKNIEEGLKQNKLEVKDFDSFILGVGPGMYTGLRVAMTVAKMFCWSLNKPLYAVSSIDILTSGYFNKDGIYPVMLHAKKGYSYTKVFEIKNGKYNTIKKEMFLSQDEFLEEIKNIKAECVISNEVENNNVKINILDLIKHEELFTKVENIHALEPNYLREDI